MLRRLVPHVAPEKFNKRMRIVFSESVYAFARWLHEYGPITKANRASFQAMVETVIEFMAGGMAAPVLKPLEAQSTAAPSLPRSRREGAKHHGTVPPDRSGVQS